MKKLTEKAAYLQGLYDGYELAEGSKEGKLLGSLLELVSDMSAKLEELENQNKELQEYIEEIDEDLGSVEEDLYGDEEETDADEADEADEDTDYYEVVCPSCGETVCFDESLDLDEVVCPACGEKISDIELCDGECDTCENNLCEQDPQE